MNSWFCSSTYPSSPVCTHPSLNVSLVASSLSKYPIAMLGPVTTSSPRSPTPPHAPSGRRMRSAVPGRRRPAEPGVPMRMSSCGNEKDVHVSVMP